jgi:hypothetical protein
MAVAVQLPEDEIKPASLGAVPDPGPIPIPRGVAGRTRGPIPDPALGVLGGGTIATDTDVITTTPTHALAVGPILPTRLEDVTAAGTIAQGPTLAPDLPSPTERDTRETDSTLVPVMSWGCLVSVSTRLRKI